MSKFSKILVALAAASAVATPAFAVTADLTGSLQLRGFASENLKDGDNSTNDEYKYFDQRFRLFTNTALHEDVKAVFAIEIDNVWGEGPGAVGTDAKSQIEIKNLYLDFNIPGANTNVKAGSQYFKHGGGLIIAEDAAGLQLRYTPVKGQSVLLSFIKADEDLPQSETDDSSYYHLQYDADVAGWRISPFVSFLDGQPTGNNLPGVPAGFANLDDFEAWYGGIEVGGKAGPVTLAAAAIYNNWDTKVSAGEENDAVALWARAAFTAGGTTLSAEAARYGDDEVGPFVNVRGYNNFAEIITGGRFDTRNTKVVYTGTSETNYFGSQQYAGGTNASYYMNFKYAKLGAEQKIGDKHKLSAFYIYAEEAEDTPDDTGTLADEERDAITFGHEIDAYYDYTISKGLTFTVGGAYLFADNDYFDNQATPASEGGDDVWKLGTALTYNF